MMLASSRRKIALVLGIMALLLGFRTLAAPALDEGEARGDVTGGESVAADASDPPDPMTDVEALSPDAPVVVDLSGVADADARALADAIPEWEEAIGAGTDRVTIPRRQAAALQARGFDLDVVSAAAVLPPWPGCYSKLEDVYAWMHSFAAAHPDLVELYDIGDSGCKQRGGCVTPGGDRIPGADIYVARITNERAASPKEGRFWIDGGLHAREIPTVELVKAFIVRVVEGFGRDAQLTYLLDHRELYVGLASNPDGRLLVEMGASEPYSAAPWMWRKNARGMEGDPCGWPPTGGGHHGVDLNRNHAFKWDAEGHSEEVCAETYRGPTPGSEPEIQAYADYVRTLFPDQRGPDDADVAPKDATGLLINFHNATFPGTVLVPWGWTTARAPNDADLMAIARRYATHNGYRTQYALYPVSGNTRDWSYGELGIPSYVIELQGSQFISPCAEMADVQSQNLDALSMMLGLADRPYLRINGPEVTRLKAPATIRQGQPATVTARVTELRAGKNPVAGVELTVGKAGGSAVGDTRTYPAPSVAPGQGLAMAATDGAFGERTEDVTLALDTRDLATGRYYVAARARDAAGNWGAVAAVAVEVGR